MQALATPSRVRILGRLHQSACAVGELADAVEMERSAVSQQLRVLRHLGLVIGERRGRSIIYALHDSHVADLLDQAVFHIEHLRLGYAERRDVTMRGRQRTSEQVEDAIVEDERDGGRHADRSERDHDPPPQLLQVLDERRLLLAGEPARSHQSVVFSRSVAVASGRL